MTEAAKNQITMADFGEITPERVAQFENDRVAQRKRDFRNRRRRNDSDELRHSELEAECERNAKSTRLTKENVPTGFKVTPSRAAVCESSEDRNDVAGLKGAYSKSE